MKPLRKKTFIIFAAAAIALVSIIKLSDPMLRAKAFVAVYGDRIETACADRLVEPDGIPAVDIDLYHGRYEHEMVEFMLGGRGLAPSSTYYGCYYSPDDVPLAFQNMDVKLTQDGHDYWVWTEVGDNRGATAKIKDKWYYFEASF